MQKYNIIHVEDDRFMSILIRSGSELNGLTYRNVCSLDSLKKAMDESMADHYIIDGNFPKTDCVNDNPELLAEDAVEYIRSKYPDARIILFSNDSDVIPEMGRRLGVNHYDKSNPGAIFDVMEKY